MNKYVTVKQCLDLMANDGFYPHYDANGDFNFPIDGEYHLLQFDDNKNTLRDIFVKASDFFLEACYFTDSNIDIAHALGQIKDTRNNLLDYDMNHNKYTEELQYMLLKEHGDKYYNDLISYIDEKQDAEVAQLEEECQSIQIQIEQLKKQLNIKRELIRDTSGISLEKMHHIEYIYKSKIRPELPDDKLEEIPEIISPYLE